MTITIYIIILITVVLIITTSLVLTAAHLGNERAISVVNRVLPEETAVRILPSKLIPAKTNAGLRARLSETYNRYLTEPLSDRQVIETEVSTIRRAWKRNYNGREKIDPDGSVYSSQTTKAFIKAAFNPSVHSLVSLEHFDPKAAKSRPFEISGNNSLLRFATTVFNEEGQLATSVLVNYHAFPIEDLAECLKSASAATTATAAVAVIAIDGEPNPLSTASKHCDVILTTKKESENREEGVYYIPYFAFWMLELRGGGGGGEIDELTLTPPTNPPPIPAALRKRSVDFVYGNCNERLFEGVRERKKISEEFDSHFKVSRLGICGNEANLKEKAEKEEAVRQSRTSYLSNHILYRDTRFVIAVENTFAPGYITEKMVAPLLAGAVPIYLGAPDVTDFFNKECFIDVRDFNGDYKALAAHVSSLTNNQIDKMASAPRFTKAYLTDSPIPSIFTGGEVYTTIAERLLSLNRKATFSTLRASMFFDSDVVFAIPAYSNETMSEKYAAEKSGFCKRIETCVDHPTSLVSKLRSPRDLVMWIEPWGVAKIRDILKARTEIVDLLLQLSISSVNSGSCTTGEWRSWRASFRVARRDHVDRATAELEIPSSL